MKLFMPAEWHPHSKCWMLWPHRNDNWRCNAKFAQSSFLAVASAISQFENVNIGVPKRFMNEARHQLDCLDIVNSSFGIELVEIESNDAWMRDVGPTFLLPMDSNTNSLYGMDWKFNAWGGIYDDFEEDNKVASAVLCNANAKRVAADFILEGGAIHVDGEGTILTTEECLLNSNRNPHLTKNEIEERLLSTLGALKVIWLPRGLAADEDTNGHIDNICCFSKPGEVLLSWTDDENDEHHERCQEALAVLHNSTDAKGRHLNVVKIPIPTPFLSYSKEECDGLESCDGIFRHPGQRLAASYVNFYIANGGIICPSFNCQEDTKALEILSNVFPNRRIIQVPGREILLGGGNIHCITQQQPQL